MIALLGCYGNTVQIGLELREHIFQDFSDSVERELALILGKITHHVHPKIVRYVEESNIDFRQKFKEISRKKCKLAPFFYKKSDCVFPGYRRPINQEKKGKWKNNLNQHDGTILNDNTVLRHIWSFLAVNAIYSGGASGTWRRSGLERFELAHIFGHKQDERDFERKVFHNFSDAVEPYGLFTSVSNVVLIPKGFAKPTDHMECVKTCFYKRHIELYGSNIVGLGKLNESFLPSWYKEIEWLDPELPHGWKAKADRLLRYREEHLKKKYACEPMLSS